jgi:transposase-like protein
MAKSRMDVTAFVGKLLKEDDADVLKEGVQVLSQALMEAEVSAQIGALPYERSADRSAYRNGYRTRTWDTRVGTIELKIPKITAGSYFPSLLEPRRQHLQLDQLRAHGELSCHSMASSAGTSRSADLRLSSSSLHPPIP